DRNGTYEVTAYYAGDFENLNAGGCALFGGTHFDLAGAVTPTAAVGAFHGSTQAMIEPEFAISGTYLLQGGVSP
ncbi:MAG: hypothetical protein ACU85V_02510, partial [Gammaproteobacteria bacterium]